MDIHKYLLETLAKRHDILSAQISKIEDARLTLTTSGLLYTKYEATISSYWDTYGEKDVSVINSDLETAIKEVSVLFKKTYNRRDIQGSLRVTVTTSGVSFILDRSLFEEVIQESTLKGYSYVTGFKLKEEGTCNSVRMADESTD